MTVLSLTTSVHAVHMQDKGLPLCIPLPLGKQLALLNEWITEWPVPCTKALGVRGVRCLVSRRVPRPEPRT